MDGEAIAFTSERYGMRNHASWGSMGDVFFVFMNQDAMDRFMMSKEDRELFDKKKAEIKKAEEKAKSDKKDDKKKDDKKKDDKKKDESKTINVEIDGISDRQIRITPMSMDISDFIVTADGNTLYFWAAGDDGPMFWELNLEEGGLSMMRKGGPTGGFATDRSGKQIFLLRSEERRVGKEC